MNYLIRKIEVSDLDKLVILCEQHSLYEKSSYNKENKKEYLNKAIFGSTPKLFCLVIEIDKQVIGYTSYTFDFSTWEAKTFLYLDCLFIEPTYRSQGIGKAIFDKLKIIGMENDCVTIQWQTPSFNEKAIKFYNKIGGKSKEKFRYTLDF